MLNKKYYNIKDGKIIQLNGFVVGLNPGAQEMRSVCILRRIVHQHRTWGGLEGSQHRLSRRYSECGVSTLLASSCALENFFFSM